MSDNANKIQEYQKELLAQYEDLRTVVYGEISDKWWPKGNLFRHFKN